MGEDVLLDGDDGGEEVSEKDEDETLRRGGVRKHEKKKDEHEIRRAGKT